MGFGEYEARAYAALLRRSPLNGYELAKSSGVPRPNIYPVLQRLEQRAAVLRLDTPTGTRYTPVPPVQLLQRLGSRFQTVLDSAERSLEKIGNAAEQESVWNARGYSTLLEHARTLVDATQHELLVALWPQEAKALAPSSAVAMGRGVAMTTLCLAACPTECGHCYGQVFRYATIPELPTRGLLVVSDSSAVLAGQVGPGEEGVAVLTRQHLLVQLASSYIRCSIALAVVLNDLGPRLGSLLGTQTRSLLASISPAAGGTAGKKEAGKKVHRASLAPRKAS